MNNLKCLWFVQGVPISMEIQWRILCRHWSMRHFYHEHVIIVVFQLKHLISKTPGLEIFKIWSVIFISNLNLFNKSKYLISSSIFKLWNYEKLVRNTASFFTFFLPCTKYQKSKTTFMSYINSPCLLGNSVY